MPIVVRDSWRSSNSSFIITNFGINPARSNTELMCREETIVTYMDLVARVHVPT